MIKAENGNHPVCMFKFLSHTCEIIKKENYASSINRLKIEVLISKGALKFTRALKRSNMISGLDRSLWNLYCMCHILTTYGGKPKHPNSHLRRNNKGNSTTQTPDNKIVT